MQNQIEREPSAALDVSRALGCVISASRRIPYADIMQTARCAAGGIKAFGLRPGDAVALLLRNDIAYFEASVAANLAGVPVVPVNWHLRADESAYILQNSETRVLVVHADLLPPLDGLLDRALRVFVVPTPPEIASAYGIPEAACLVPAGYVDWNEWVSRCEPAGTVAETAPPPVIYTSGTTGRPKGVRRASANAEMAMGAGELGALVLGLEPAMRTVVTGPMYHSAPNAIALTMAASGADVWLQPRFDAEELLRAIEDHRLTHLYLVPTMFVRLLKLPVDVQKKYDISSLRYVVHAAAPCSPDVKRRMIDWWGPVIAEFYGSTETNTVTYCTSAEWLAHPGTVGRAVPRATVKILDEAGSPLPAGEIGEIYARNGAIADFTYKGDEGKRSAVEREGLITSGDVGYLDADGYLFICDRRRDMVISGGVNIYPAEIEAAILTMTGVQDCAVFGIPHEEYGESLLAAVHCMPGVHLDAASVQAHVRKHLAGFKVPGRIEFLDELPREDSGKIFKRKLRDPYWAAAGRRI